MRIETDVPGNFIAVYRDGGPGVAVCVEAVNRVGGRTCSSLTRNKAVALAHAILRLVRFSEPEPLGADW